MTATCHWAHDPLSGDCFSCLDAKYTVCARCCVERCPIETPDWFAHCARRGHPTWPKVVQDRTVPAKLVCLESYWDKTLFQSVSVKGFLDALRPLIAPPLMVAHRFVESRRGLAYYVKRPHGVLSTEPDAWDAPIYYLAFHGVQAGLVSVLETIKAEVLCKIFRGYGDFDNLVYFGACSVLEGPRGVEFARDFLRASGCRAVIDYTTKVDWMPSLVTDLLFLHRFYSNPDPWRNLSRIFDSVQQDFACAQGLGYTLVLPSD